MRCSSPPGSGNGFRYIERKRRCIGFHFRKTNKKSKTQQTADSSPPRRQCVYNTIGTCLHPKQLIVKRRGQSFVAPSSHTAFRSH
eukprot:scaffold4626_cov110-Skeletonema_dohrnii-CCMP3373.AAC.12